MSMGYNQSIAAPYGGTGGGYPVHIEFPILESHNRFYAVPFIGYMVKELMLIPYMIALMVLTLLVSVCQLFLWIPVLFTGQYPEFGRNLNMGYIRWVKRTGAFMYGLTDRYPSFSLDDHPGDGDAMVIFEPQPAYNRFWAIPLVGATVKYIILIPHLIMLYVLGIVVSLINLVTWIPVISGGRYPLWGYQLVGGWIRWSARVMAYWFGLTDQYPPFSLSE